jgi:hypothetical protein
MSLKLTRQPNRAMSVPRVKQGETQVKPTSPYSICIYPVENRSEEEEGVKRGGAQTIGL